MRTSLESHTLKSPNPVAIVACAIFASVTFSGLVTYYTKFVWPDVIAQQFDLAIKGALILGGLSIVFEPVFVFLLSWILGRRFNPGPHIRQLIPGLFIACVSGFYLGFGLGWLVWPTVGFPTPMGTFPSINWLFAPAPSTIVFWGSILSPPLRAFLTGLAGLGFAQIQWTATQ